MLAALTEPERAVWMWRHGLMLDPHLVVCQVRDGAHILVLGHLLDRHYLVPRPTFSLRLQVLTLGGHRYPLVACGVARPGERDPLWRSIKAWMVCRDGAQGVKAK